MIITVYYAEYLLLIISRWYLRGRV